MYWFILSKMQINVIYVWVVLGSTPAVVHYGEGGIRKSNLIQTLRCGLHHINSYSILK